MKAMIILIMIIMMGLQFMMNLMITLIMMELGVVTGRDDSDDNDGVEREYKI